MFPVSSLDVPGVSPLTAAACRTREQFLQSVMRGRTQSDPAEHDTAAPGFLSDPKFPACTWYCFGSDIALPVNWLTAGWRIGFRVSSWISPR